jgi:formylmethanofuran dehydrogenase subunit C
VLAEENTAVLTPVFVDGDEFPGDGGSQGAEDGFVGGVDVEGRGDAVEQRIVGGELDAGEVAVAGDVSGAVEHADAGPVVDGLQGQVEVVVGFELEDGEAALAGDGEKVE